MGRCTVAITGVLVAPVVFHEERATLIVRSDRTYRDRDGKEHQTSTTVACGTKGEVAIWAKNHLTPGKEVILIGSLKNDDDRLRIAIYRIIPTASSWREGEAPPEVKEPEDEIPL